MLHAYLLYGGPLGRSTANKNKQTKQNYSIIQKKLSNQKTCFTP